MVTAAMKLKDAPWKKSCDKPRQCIKKQRHHFVNKGLYIQSYGFSISHVLTENWIIKKTEPWRIVAFELWCWRRLPRVPWTTRKSSPSILKEINPEYSLEGLMLKLKLQTFGHLMPCVCCQAQSCLTLCNPVDCNPPGSSVSGISRQEYCSG